MDLLLVLAHPRPGSFNHAISERIVETVRKKGHNIIFHDLYEDRFDSILSYDEIPRNDKVNTVIDGHCNDLIKSEGIIIVHPNWWGQPPAILKGWVDRVIRPGVAYIFEEGDNGEGIPIGLLKGKAALVFNTSNTPLKREREVFGDPLQLIWKNCIFEFCGVTIFHRRMFETIVTSSPEQRNKWLDEVTETTVSFFNL